MRFGLGVLRLAPCDFWATTPREIHAAAEGCFGPRAAPTRAALDDLMLQFPDARKAVDP